MHLDASIRQAYFDRKMYPLSNGTTFEIVGGHCHTSIALFDNICALTKISTCSKIKSFQLIRMMLSSCNGQFCQLFRKASFMQIFQDKVVQSTNLAYLFCTPCWPSAGSQIMQHCGKLVLGQDTEI